LDNEETLVSMAWPTSVKEIMGKHGLATSTSQLHSARRSVIMKAFTNTAINGEDTNDNYRVSFHHSMIMFLCIK